MLALTTHRPQDKALLRHRLSGKPGYDNKLGLLSFPVLVSVLEVPFLRDPILRELHAHSVVNPRYHCIARCCSFVACLNVLLFSRDLFRVILSTICFEIRLLVFERGGRRRLPLLHSAHFEIYLFVLESEKKITCAFLPNCTSSIL